MFDIEYKGGNTVVIATKGLRLVVDPKLSLLGQADAGVKDAVVLATEERFLVEAAGAHLVIEGPGEYEVGDFSIRGVAATRHIDVSADISRTTMYRISIGEVHIALIGNIANTLNEDQLEALGVVDILILPVGGGGYTLDSAAATQLTRQIDPKLVIPVHYADSGLTYEVPQDPLKLFTDELGAPIETVDKYKLKTVSALPQAMTVIELKRS